MKFNETIGSLAVIVLIAFGLYSFTKAETNSQNDSSSKSEKTPRTIHVTGSAEMIVPPDQIELEITILENTGTKLEKAEEKLVKILEEHHISQDKISFNQANNHWYWYYWWSYRHRPILRKQLYVNLDSETDFLALVKELNQTWVENVRVHQTNHSRIQELREEVKIEAVRAARKKASYLLDSIDEELGKVVSIEEVNTHAVNNSNPYWYYSGRNNFNSNSVSNSVVNYTPSSSGDEGTNHTHDIKLRYEIAATFNIK